MGHSVDFDGAIDLSDKPVASQKAHCPCEEKYIQRHDKRITKVYYAGRNALKLEFCIVVMSSVYEEVYRSKPGCQKTSPPPPVIFCG